MTKVESETLAEIQALEKLLGTSKIDLAQEIMSLREQLDQEKHWRKEETEVLIRAIARSSQMTRQLSGRLIEAAETALMAIDAGKIEKARSWVAGILAFEAIIDDHDAMIDRHVRQMSQAQREQ